VNDLKGEKINEKSPAGYDRAKLSSILRWEKDSGI
jgi:hypothetical protein